MYSFQEMLFSVAVAVYVATSLAIAAVRWGHKCKPYDRHADYYYPAWKALVSCMLSNILLSPIVFMPTQEDAVLYLRMILILASPFLCAVVLYSYFGRVLKVGWQNPINILAIPFCLMTLSAFVMTLMPGTQLEGTFCKWYFSVAGTLALIYMGCFVQSIRMIARALQRFSENNYSNPDDFPGQFAKGILWIPILYVAVSWVCTFIGSYSILSICMVILSVLGIVFLIGALAPHRTLEVDQLESGEIKVESVLEMTEPSIPDIKSEPATETLSQERKSEIVAIIRHYVEDEHAYLDSHITLNSLSRICGVNRTYISQVITEYLGGFYSYVNRCRLAHAARIKDERPDASIEEIVTASGFGSRQSYYNVRRQLESR